MEALVTAPSFWRGRRVFLTGHTGFKGGWLALWLADLGAEVTGFSLPPATTPSLFGATRLSDLVHHQEGDIRDLGAVTAAMTACAPEVVLHLAAQPLVRLSYREPVETFAVNVMGTVNVLEAARRIEGLGAVVCITTDKCYENLGPARPFVESDPMGGHDPYSASKGCAEIAIAGYRRSFFGRVGVASARAGNVIGGGDWSEDRLVPDVLRALAERRAPLIRNPAAVRPWQHVLEPLRGYMMLAERLSAGDAGFAEGWNFGPRQDDCLPVREIVDRLARRWGASIGWETSDGPQPHEAAHLRLDCAKAESRLGWRPALRLDDALALVGDWSRAHAAGADMRTVTLAQIHAYQRRVADSGLELTA
jgi:CDP-glucose 4,6-dehydratase